MADNLVQISVRIADADGEIASMPIYGFAADAVTLLQLIGDVQNIVSSLDDILDGKVLKIGVCLDVVLPAGLKGAAVAGSEIERTAIFPMEIPGSGNKHLSLDIPAFAYSKFFSGSNQVNMADTAVSAFWNNLFTPVHFHMSLPDVVWSPIAPTSGAKTFRKHRKQTKRT